MDKMTERLSALDLKRTAGSAVGRREQGRSDMGDHPISMKLGRTLGWVERDEHLLSCVSTF
jgi:hypothetical protein